MLKKYRTLLFDMDGTLVDTDDLIRQTFIRLYRKYRPGYQASPEQMFLFSGPPIGETLRHEFPQQNQEALLKEFHDISWKLYPQCLKTYPHAKETLQSLRKEGYHLGIVTNKIHQTTLYCLQLLGFDNIFDAIIGFDDVIHSKPQGEGIEKAMQILKETDHHRVLYIGDNDIDFMTGQNAGVDVALVQWGPRKINPLLKPRYRIQSFKNLWEVLQDE